MHKFHMKIKINQVTIEPHLYLQNLKSIYLMEPLKNYLLIVQLITYIQYFLKSKKILKLATKMPAKPITETEVCISKPISVSNGILTNASPNPKYVLTKPPKNIANRINTLIISI